MIYFMIYVMNLKFRLNLIFFQVITKNRVEQIRLQSINHNNFFRGIFQEISTSQLQNQILMLHIFFKLKIKLTYECKQKLCNEIMHCNWNKLFALELCICQCNCRHELFSDNFFGGRMDNVDSREVRIELPPAMFSMLNTQAHDENGEDLAPRRANEQHSNETTF